MRNFCKASVPLLLVLLATSTASGQSLKIGGETKLPAYRLVELRPENAAPDSAILWDVYPEDGVDSRESNGVLLFVAPPGTYKVKLRTIKGKDVQLARATVTIGDAPPVPVPPDPTPPNPVPPTDPLVASLKAALDSCPATDKPLKAKLQSLYKEAAAMVIAKRPDGVDQWITPLPTWAELRRILKDSAVQLGLADKLVPLHGAIATELRKSFPSEDGNFTDSDRQKASDALARIANALGRVN